MNLQLAKDVALIASSFVPKSQKEGIAQIIYESVEKAEQTQNTVLDRINTIESTQNEILRLLNQLANPDTDLPNAEPISEVIPEQLDAIESDVLEVIETLEEVNTDAVHE